MVVALVAVAAAVLPVATASAADPPIAWQPCGSGLQCGSLMVPLSYAKPHGPTLTLAVARSVALGHRVGDLFLNPGGPGESGIAFLKEAASEFPAAIRQHFDLVTFDPRGVAGSDPVTCLSGAALRAWGDLDPDPATPAAVAADVAGNQAFSTSCRQATSGSLLANLSTLDEAKDLDRFRVALGDPTINYYGASYGTYLGALYAQHFGSHLRTMVLDGAINPALTVSQIDRQQAIGLQGDLGDFFTWCASDAKCRFESDGTPAAWFGRLVASLAGGRTINAEFNPALGGTQPIGAGLIELGVAYALYDASSWPDLGDGVAAALGGNATELGGFGLAYLGFEADGTASNIMAASMAIGCVDRPSPTSVAAYQTLSASLAKVSPVFGPETVWTGLVCATWPVPPVGPVGAIHDPGAPPVVVVGATADPVTPFANTTALAHQLRGGVVLTRKGDGHTSYLVSSCIERWVDRYLLTTRTPPAHTVCASNS
jgi:pimeloyl-ACP methyl ester carboxylesterase